MTSVNLEAFFAAVDKSSALFVDRLKHAVAIPSVSSDPDRRPDLVRMAEWLAERLELLGVQIKLHELPCPSSQAGGALPPVLVARKGHDVSKKTLLAYGHYDVQPARLEDGWNSDPFSLVIDGEGRMFGRGSTDDKGPVVAWLNMIQAYADSGQELPVNLILCFEGMEESGSLGLGEFLQANADSLFADVDAICISDSCRLGRKPTLVYGLRGMNYYSVEIEGPFRDLHSGVFGGAVREPLHDMVSLLHSLLDDKGDIAIPGIAELVPPLTDRERKLYENVDFTESDLQEAIGSKTNRVSGKEAILLHRWRYPSLSIHGVEGAFSGTGAKTVIPAAIKGKFSIRTVPDMTVEQVNHLVNSHLEAVFKKLNSPNTMTVQSLVDGAWWLGDPHDDNFRSAAQAIRDVWGIDPDFVREGGSIPVAVTMADALGKSLVLLPMGASDDAAHSTNEKMNVEDYIQGTKTLGAYIAHLAERK